MRIKSFRADTAREALVLVRQEMGEDAVILDSRAVRAGGVLGLGGREMVEVMAAVDEQYAASEVRADGAILRQQTSASGSRPELPETPERIDALAAIRELQAEVLEIKSLVRAGVAGSRPVECPATRLMRERGVDVERLGLTADELAAVREEETLAHMLSGVLKHHVAPPAFPGRSVIALVGPTGVGKTTTLAKLAARAALREHRSTALITCDTFRIGAVEQLRVYSRILNIPLEVAAAPEDMARAVRKQQDAEVILIDTIGRNHRNALQLRELQALLAPASPTEVHLVLPAAASLESQLQAIANFSVLSPDRLIVSKIDEAAQRGCIVNLPVSTGLRVSCVTDGQNVPDDIHFAEPRLLAGLVVGVGE